MQNVKLRCSSFILTICALLVANVNALGAELLEATDEQAKMGYVTKDRIQGVRWVNATPPLFVKRQGKKAKLVAKLKGQFVRPNWNLLFIPKDAESPKQELSGIFEIEVLLTAQKTFFELVAVGPRGEAEKLHVGIALEDYDSLLASYQKKDGAPASGKGKRHLFNAGLGGSSYSYSQTNNVEMSQIATTAKITYIFKIRPERWSFDFTAFGTALSVSSSRAEHPRYLGLNTRVGYQVPGIRGKYTLKVFSGVYYSSMLVSGNTFGFRHLKGLQLFPHLSIQFNPRNSLGFYGKVSPLAEGLGIMSLENREFATGLSWTHILRNKHPLSVGLDYANLKASSNGVGLDLSSISLGLSYGF